MGNPGSLFLTGLAFNPCPFAFGDVREPGCSSAVHFIAKMLCNLGCFPPLVFSLQGALLKITCWLLFFGGRTRLVPFGCMGCTVVLRSRTKTSGCQLGLNLYCLSTLLTIALILCSEGPNFGCLGPLDPQVRLV